MNKRLLFFDIDGTLVNGADAHITESAVEAMKKAQANGHLCFINSGRPMGSIGENITEFPFDGYVCGCGTHVIYHGKEILHNVIDKKIVRELIDWNEKEHIDIFFEGPEGLVFPPEAEFKDLALMEYYFKKQGAQVRSYQYGKDLDIPIDKFSMWYDKDNPPMEYRKYLEQHFEIIQRAADFWEVVPKGFSKATGIDCLVEHLGQNIEDTISFGDSQNDLTMLEHTGLAVVMGNGDENLKQMVDYVTAAVEDDGILQALEYLNLI